MDVSLKDLAEAYDMTEVELQILMSTNKEFYKKNTYTKDNGIMLNHDAMETLEQMILYDAEKVSVFLEDVSKYVNKSVEELEYIITLDTSKKFNRMVSKAGTKEATIKYKVISYLLKRIEEIEDLEFEDLGNGYCKRVSKSEKSKEIKSSKSKNIENTPVKETDQKVKKEPVTKKTESKESVKKDMVEKKTAEPKKRKSTKKTTETKEVNTTSSMNTEELDVKTIRMLLIKSKQLEIEDIATMSDKEIELLFQEKYVIITNRIMLEKEVFEQIVDKMIMI